jgi:two-component system alkaline phosphatase synthesis response regulator PhoP
MTPAKRILIVDDEPTILFLLEQLLTAEGYEVVTASNGDEAHRLSRTQWFDLFLIDLIMPSKDGIETILSLRTFRVSTPIIAMSGGWNEGRRSCLPLAGKVGACGTLAKPFDRDTLLGTIRSFLESAPHRPHPAFSPAIHGNSSLTDRAVCGRF